MKKKFCILHICTFLASLEVLKCTFMIPRIWFRSGKDYVEEKKGDVFGFLLLFFSLIRTFAPHNALPIKTTDKILLQLL